MRDQINLLIELLLDKDASIAERDDAAIELADYTDECVENALVSIAKNENEDKLILNSYGESLASIWVMQNFFKTDEFFKLTGTPRYGIYFVIKSRKPEWIKKYALNKNKFLN